MPPMDPAMMAGGGMPPMDPAMMAAAGGGMPGVDPMTGLPPMDPSMMAGAGMPPMDPAAMAGGMPPMPEAPQTVQVSLEDLRAILAEASGKSEGEGPAGDQQSVEKRLDNIEGMLGALLEVFGGAPEGDMAGMPAPEPPAGMEGMLPPLPAAAPETEMPEDFSLLENAGEPPVPEPQKQASGQQQDKIGESIRRLRLALNS